MLGVFPKGEVLYVIDVQKEPAIMEFLHCFYRVAATLKVVGDIQFQFDVARIRNTHDLIKLLGALAERGHVIVISERDSEISGALAEVGEGFPQQFEIRRGCSPALRAIVDDLEVESAGVA